MRRTLSVLGLCAASAFATALPNALAFASGEEDAADWLERLRSGSASERELAQRWLATHLVSEHYADLASFAGRADAELRRRLLEALAGDDRHLELVVLLASEENESLAELGSAAFAELATRWCARAARESVPQVRVLEVVQEVAEELYELPASEEPAAYDLDRIARLTDLRVPLVVAPELQERRSAPRPRFEGTVADLLQGISVSDRTSFAGVGDWSAERPGPASFALASTIGGARRAPGLERLSEWCQRIQRTEQPSRRASAAARALACTGWPAALAWLEQRWIARRDRNSLEGLLAAAERGRVVPALSSPDARREVLSVADLALASGEEAGVAIAERCARALSGLGPITPGGEDPGPVLVEGWALLQPAERWVRLVALEGTQSSDRRVVATLVELAQDERRVSPSLRLQALRALARVPAGRPASVRPAGMAELWLWAQEEGHAGELASLFVACRVPLSRELLTSAWPSQRASAALFVADWAWRASDAQLAGELVREHALGAASARAPDADWVAALAAWVARDGPGPVRTFVAHLARELEPQEREILERTALLAGALAPEGEVRLFAGLADESELGPLELELLAALAVGPRGTSARERLLAELAACPSDALRAAEVAQAFDLAALALRRARLDEELAGFAADARARLAAGEHVLDERLAPPRWPPEVRPRAVRLDLLDRRLPSGL